MHYNFLIGELLVNNIPVSRVSTEYKKHLIYQLLFGESILDVISSNLPGMQFFVKALISEHIVNLGLERLDH